MSSTDFKAVASLKLSEPVPTELIPLVREYMKGRPEWLRRGLQSLIDNS